MAKLFVDSENAVTMGATKNFKGHGCGAFLTVFDTASRTESAFTTKRDKFEVTTSRAGIHGTAKRWVPTIDHPINVIDDVLIWVQNI